VTAGDEKPIVPAGDELAKAPPGDTGGNPTTAASRRHQPGAVLPHPALLEIAATDGTLIPALREYEEELLLEPDTLVPLWFPHETEDREPMNADERRGAFVTMFQAIRKADFWNSLDRQER
jgi:hypothetical protein